MTIKTGVVAGAEDERLGLTLDELAAFVQNAMRNEIPGDVRVHVRVTMRGTIKRIETKP